MTFTLLRSAITNYSEKRNEFLKEGEDQLRHALKNVEDIAIEEGAPMEPKMITEMSPNGEGDDDGERMMLVPESLAYLLSPSSEAAASTASIPRGRLRRN